LKKIIKCLTCGKEIEVYPSSKKKYCSRKCAAANQTKKMEASKVSFTCEQCGKEFFRTAREIRNAEYHNTPIRFCCRQCKDTFWGKDRVVITCCVCGKQFLVQQKDVRKHKTCSPECAKHNVHNRQVFNKGIITLTCQYCKKKFSKRVAFVEKSARRGQPVKYCSKSCQKKATGHVKLPTITVQCEHCGKDFQVKTGHSRKFCSQECRLQFAKRNSNVLTCQYCGEEFIATGYQIKHGRKFCSIQCRNKARIVEKSNYAKFQHYIRTSKEYESWRLAVLKKANFCCEDCGAVGVLHAHHKKEMFEIAKQYDFDIQKTLASPEFNDINNGECLCVQCHIKRHPYHKKLRNCKGQFCRREFNPTNQIHDDQGGIKLEGE